MTHKSSTTSSEEEAIRRLVADLDTFQSDAQRFPDLLTEGVVLVNIAGRRVVGREALRAAMTEALESHLARVFTKVEVVDVTFLRPEVAVVSCIKHVRDENVDSSNELPASGSLTYVTVDEGDAWRVALAQTTPVQA